jgi:hypothetical protein
MRHTQRTRPPKGGVIAAKLERQPSSAPLLSRVCKGTRTYVDVVFYTHVNMGKSYPYNSRADKRALRRAA